MKHRIVWVGRKAACPFLAAADDYRARLSHCAKIELIMLRPSDPVQEARAMAKAAAGSDVVVALDEHGQQHTTLGLATFLGAPARVSQSICYLIGGADGFAPGALALAHHTWSLSAMTLPHRGVLALWLEQLYRVHSVLSGGRYHRGER